MTSANTYSYLLQGYNNYYAYFKPKSEATAVATPKIMDVFSFEFQPFDQTYCIKSDGVNGYLTAPRDITNNNLYISNYGGISCTPD